jgi:tetratricopeptide (TPR) repeat protein
MPQGSGAQGSGPRRRPKPDQDNGPRKRRTGAEARGNPRRGGDRPRDWSRDRGGKPRAERSAERSAEQARYDGPPLPEDVTGKELDRSVLDQLRGLPEKLAARVARHLAAAGLVVDEDPETAYQHALAARARAARIAVVREACGEAAYAAGHFAEALSELRAAKRMNGSIDYLPIMADCERALGRPERALELARSPAVGRLSKPQQVELTIVEAGARFELGETDSALRTLENAHVQSASREPWVVRLRYAYADLLAKAGRHEDALEWFHRTAAIDGQEITDAAERVAGLEQGRTDG